MPTALQFILLRRGEHTYKSSVKLQVTVPPPFKKLSVLIASTQPGPFLMPCLGSCRHKRWSVNSFGNKGLEYHSDTVHAVRRAEGGIASKMSHLYRMLSLRL